MKQLPLFQHQKDSIQFILPRDRTFDTSDPGTGKTRTAIEVFAVRRLQGAGCCLILAPKSLLRSAWAEDFEKFAPQLELSIAYAENRAKAFEKSADVYITNVDATKWLAKQPAAFWKRFKDGMLILDESTAFKHHTSARSRALSKIKNHFKYRHAMTGTPNTNSITDLWHQVYVLDDGARLGQSFYAFRNNTCIPQQVGPVASMVRWSDRPGIEQVVSKLIEDITIRHKLEDCVDIPDNVVRPVHYTLSKQQQARYDEMEDMAVTLLANGKAIDAVNGAAVLTKLLQIASGAVYAADGTYGLVETDRYELVADLADARSYSIVFFLWEHQRDQLIDEFKKRGLTYVVVDGSTSPRARAEAVKSFQAGFYRVLLAHPQSAGHGLTLTRGVATIWASPTYNLEHWLQGNRRIYRAGQTQKTETLVVVAPGTVEDRVTQRLQAKDAQQLNLLALLENRVIKR